MTLSIDDHIDFIELEADNLKIDIHLIPGVYEWGFGGSIEKATLYDMTNYPYNTPPFDLNKRIALIKSHKKPVSFNLDFGVDSGHVNIVFIKSDIYWYTDIVLRVFDYINNNV